MTHTIQNSQIHTYQGMVVDPFGDEGAARLVPTVNGEPIGQPALVLDKQAVVDLIDALVEIHARVSI